MAKYTRAVRERIVKDYFEATGREVLHVKEFVDYVAEIGPSHPAYDWFQWDDAVAGENFRIEQARQFVQGLTIRCRQTAITATGPVSIAVREAPMLYVPMGERQTGGGYHQFDPNDPQAIASLKAEATATLGWFARRYALILTHLDNVTIDGLVARLSEPELPVAAE